MKRPPFAALRMPGVAPILAAAIAVLLLPTGSAQNAPAAPASPAQGAPAQGAPAPGTQGGTGTNTGTQGNATPTTTSPNGTQQDNNKKQIPGTPPSATNPLLLGKSDTQLPIGPQLYSDFRHDVQVGVVRSLRDMLPVFGLDFFQPARDQILAKRAFLRRMWLLPTDNAMGQFRPATDAYGNPIYGSQNFGPNNSPNNGLPNNGLPNNGLPNNGFPNNGFPNNGNPSNGIPNNGAPNNGNPNNGNPNNGAPNNGAPYNGTPYNRAPNNGNPNNANPSNGAPYNGVPPYNGAPNNGSPNNGVPPNNGAPNNGSPNNGIPYYGAPSGVPYSGVPGSNQPTTGTPGTVTLADGTVVYVPGAPGAAPQSGPSAAAASAAYGANGNGFQQYQPQQMQSVSAFDMIADPLSLQSQNVLATIPPNYQLSTGDSLVVRYWSPRHEPKTQNSTVDQTGAISLEDLGPLMVRGQTLAQAEKTIGQRLRRLYTGVEVSVVLAKLRTIQVTLAGSAFLPGTYAVPSVSTAYNVVAAAGGPMDDGSMRAIEVRRNGKIVGTLDLYNFLLVGNHGEDIQLQSGDLVYIPHRRSRIAVAGEVLQPAVYELRDGETVKDVLQYSGGVRASAVAQRIRVSTFDPGAGRVQKDVDLNSSTGKKQPLYDGDDVEVLSVRPLLTNTVVVDGAVDQPSTYALTPGMRVADLVDRARGLISEAYTPRANLYRWNPNNTTTLITIDLRKALAHDPDENLLLERWDRLAVYNRKEVAWIGQRTVSVRGAVQRAGAYSLSDNMKISDLVLLAGGPTPDAKLDKAILLHAHGDGSYGMDYVNLAGVTGKDASRDLKLVDGDLLAVYKVGEAQFEPDHVVTIQGAVVAPGAYPRTDSMHLSDLLALAGGFKPDASHTVNIAHARRLAGAAPATLNLVQVKFNERNLCAPQDDVVLEDGDVVTIQGTGGYVETVKVVQVNGAVNRPGPVIMTSKTMRLTDAIAAAGGLRPEAFPAGAEFNRDPKLMSTENQRSLAATISNLNDLLNQDTFNRERAKALSDQLGAIHDQTQPDASPLGGTSAPAAAPVIPNALIGVVVQQPTVSPARKLTDDQINGSGSIAVNLPEALRRPKGLDDILLVDGDTISVPEAPTTVQVVGAVVHGRGVLYKPGATLDYYLANAGGFAPDAAKDRVEVIHVGGGLIPASKAGRLLPGDVIVVPTRVLAEKLTKHQDAIGSFFKSLTSSAIVFRLASSLFGL